MAYKASKSKLINDSIQLCDENDNIIKEINYSWRPSELSTKITQSYNQIIRSKDAILKVKDDPFKLYEIISVESTKILTMVLGPEKTEEISNHFDDDGLRFAHWINDFINDVIQPEVEKFVKQKNKKRNRFSR